MNRKPRTLPMIPISRVAARLDVYGYNIARLRKSIPRDAGIVIHAHRPLLILAGLYVAVAFLLGAAGFQSPSVDVVAPFISTLSAMFLMLLPIAIISGGLALRIAHVLLTLTIFIGIEFAALGIKANLTLISPWSWDGILAHLDRLLFLGTHPWRLLHPIADHPHITLGLDMAYKLWMAILLASWLLVAVSTRHDGLRIRYILAFLLAWVAGGNILAFLLSSAGPAFLQHMGLETDAAAYADLMSYLKTVDSDLGLTAVSLQNILWEQYETGRNTFGGISAFPSMHNALAALMALAAWQAHRWLGILMTAFTVLIFAGSILLAWHYAVDGIAGIAIAFPCWHAAGHITRRLERLPAIRRYRALLRATANN